jgi:hypothetical protein
MHAYVRIYRLVPFWSLADEKQFVYDLYIEEEHAPTQGQGGVARRPVAPSF